MGMNNIGLGGGGGDVSNTVGWGRKDVILLWKTQLLSQLCDNDHVVHV